ncbi:MAG TPA: DsbA family protein [Anaerolineae bacterium]|nr:DsbA family protein [Anaerolineae bacterium]
MTSIRRELHRSACRTRWVFAVLSISLLSVFLLSGLVGCSTPTPVPTPTNTPTLPPETPTAELDGTPEATREPLVPLDDDPVLGSADAPVTIIEYSEYLCPFCRTFALETLPLIEEQYIDTGKVRFIYRDFPVHGQPAVIMSMVAECAADQGKFWEMQSFVWERSDEWSQSENLLATVQGYADELGIDTEEYTSCLEEGTVVERIIEDYNVGVQDGVEATPSFLINGTLVRGALPFEKFQKVIEEKLAESG